MPTLLSGTRTLTIQITDPEISDSVSCYVFLTTTSTTPSTPSGVYTGAPTPSQPATGAGVMFSPTVTVPSGVTGTFYAWIEVLINGQPWGMYSQSAALTIGGITVTNGTWS